MIGTRSAVPLTRLGPAPVRAPAQVARRDPRIAERRLVTVVVVLLALALAGVLRLFVVGPVRVGSASMEPTLRAGDVVLVDRRALDVADLGRGDLVTFRHPGTGAETLRRVVALPGETVAVRDGVLHVDGAAVPGPSPDAGGRAPAEAAALRVPADAVYVLGDNPATSVDSRDLGPVAGSDLDGRVLVRIWPPYGLRDTDPPALSE